MKFLSNPKNLPVFSAGAGLMALVLRSLLFLLGQDEKNLLIPGHPLDLLVWIVTAAVAAVILASVWKLAGSSGYADNFGPSAAAAVGSFALAGGIAVSVILGASSGLRLEMLYQFIGALAVPAVVWSGLCRWKGKQPFFLLHGIVCLYLTLYSISHYQTWSSQPQMQDWFFDLAGIVCLVLFSYYQTAFPVGLGKRRLQLLVGLLGGFFCIGAIAGSEDFLLYLGGALWMLTNLCSLTPASRRRKNPITEKDIPHETA
jgi:hypothetical protein